MKKAISRILSLLLAFYTLVLLTSCGNTLSQAEVGGQDQNLTADNSVWETLIQEKKTDTVLHDLSRFTAYPYGTVNYRSAAAFSSDGTNAMLVLVGDTVKRSNGAFSATEQELTIGKDHYTYAFFNEYLLIQDGENVHILSPKDSARFEAACAVLLSSELAFDKDVLSLTLPKIGKVSGIWHFDKDRLILDYAKQTNYALGAKVTASSDEGSSTAARYAVDGNLNTRWSSSYHDNQWLVLDLGEEKTVTRIRILWETSAAKSFTLATSLDGKTYTSVFEEDNNTIVNAYGDYSFAATKARYIKLSCHTRLNGYGFSLYEFEVYEHYQEPTQFTYSYENGKAVLIDGESRYEFATDFIPSKKKGA